MKIEIAQKNKNFELKKIIVGFTVKIFNRANCELVDGEEKCVIYECLHLVHNDLCQKIHGNLVKKTDSDFPQMFENFHEFWNNFHEIFREIFQCMKKFGSH